MKDLPLTLGGGFNWTPAIVCRPALTERVSTGVKRQLDLYGLWKFTASTQLRLAANNLLADDYDSGRTSPPTAWRNRRSPPRAHMQPGASSSK